MERELKNNENEKLNVLKGFYRSILSYIRNGIDCFQELSVVKKQMDEHYKSRSEKYIDKMRCLQIDDMVYDLHKLQNKKKV
jgi:hypothetical protein